MPVINVCVWGYTVNIMTANCWRINGVVNARAICRLQYHLPAPLSIAAISIESHNVHSHIAPTNRKLISAGLHKNDFWICSDIPREVITST